MSEQVYSVTVKLILSSKKKIYIAMRHLTGQQKQLPYYSPLKPTVVFCSERRLRHIKLDLLLERIVL